ncbi:MAG: hypothetical protein HFJ30_08170 [Clostridia bacterium]|jgi:hypothetical protein|nr:hypothetical protein [Clostridia bacterium]
MLIETGYVYHIKEEYFKVARDKKLMRNHENGNTRPTYLFIRNANSKILWFAPMSSKVEKYKKIQEEKIKKNGTCDTIVIEKYRKKYSVFLIQNIFLVTKEYIDHIDTSRDKAVPVVAGTQKEITTKVNKVFRLKANRNKFNISRCRQD